MIAFRTSIPVVALGLSLFAVPACATQVDTPPPPALSRFQLDQPADHRWELPRRLREISGLALSSDGRLFGHNDELAIIFQINLQNGELVKAFAMGRRTAAGDFEGIAIVDDRFYLVTSDGRIYESGEGNDGDRLIYNTYGTSAGRACEIEGLAYDPDNHHLIMVCKTPRASELRDAVTLFKWSLETHTMAADSMVRIPLSRITSRISGKEFSPSGIIRDPTTGHYIIIAARQDAMVEITLSGTVVATHEFRKGVHKQMEGVELAGDGSLVIADEGRNGRAHITVYKPLSRP